jgi:hypothetical protein
MKQERCAWVMEEALFSRLWAEVDFDDHPYPGSHSPEPQGQLTLSTHDGALTIGDERITFRLGNGGDGEDSIHRWTSEPTKMNSGPERMGEHRWSISPKDLGFSLSAFVAVKVGRPEKVTGHSVLEERILLGQIRNSLSPHLPDWTWHLEVDNKPDRMGWYVRAPEQWESLFTIFVGLGWHPSSPEEKRGFLLFERAPPDELDRADEAEANRLDTLRTVALCNSQRGALTTLTNDPEWAHQATAHQLEDLPGDVQLWPPSMERWPLLVARQNEQTNSDDTSAWAATIVEALGPAISTLPAKIDGLNWQ